MSILINRSTRVVVQGITGKAGAFFTKDMIQYGTKIAAGVTPARVRQTRSSRKRNSDGAPPIERVDASATANSSRAAEECQWRHSACAFLSHMKLPPCSD